MTEDALARTGLPGRTLSVRTLSVRVQIVIVAAVMLVALIALAVPAVVARLGGDTRAAVPERTQQGGVFRPTEAQWASIKTQPVEIARFRPQQSAEGNIAVDDDLTTQIFSPFSGRVTKLFAKLGDSVERGAPLLAVEATEFVQAQNDLLNAAAAARTARSQLTLSQITEKRAHELFQAQGGSLKDWQQAQADLASAQNTLRSGEAALGAVRNRLRILGRSDQEISSLERASETQRLDPASLVRAPISGIVTQRQVGAGQYIQASAAAPVYTIGDLSTVWLVANIREVDAPLMRVGQQVEVRVLAYPQRIFKAKIAWVAPSIDPNTRRLQIRADVENSDGALKPFMFANFSIITGPAVDAAAIPQEAVILEGEVARVWVAQPDGSLTARAVRTGRVSDGKIEIVEGLSAGQKVVTAGTLFIDRAASGD